MRIIEERDIFADDNTDEHLRFIQTEEGVDIYPHPSSGILLDDIQIFTPGRHSPGLSFVLDLCGFDLHLRFSWDVLQKLSSMSQDRIKIQSE